MIRIHLPEADVQHLEAFFRNTPDRTLRDRVQIVLMAHRGRPRQDIASDLGIHRRSVTRWLHASGDGGLDALRPRKAKGAAAMIPAALADEVKRWVIEGPAKQGLDRANRTHEELLDHLLKAHGIRTSRSVVQRFCVKIGIGVYRPTSDYRRGNPEKPTQAKEDSAGLKKKRRRERSSC